LPTFTKALDDPDLRKRLIDEYREFESSNPVEQLGRPFTGKEFTPGQLYDSGPRLVEVQKTLEEVTAKADRSNADPLYQQARQERGGYDTCVTERTSKLRAQKKTASTTTATPAEQHKRPQKKTQTPDYRGKGGVRASAD